MTKQATGPFEVKVTPLEPAFKTEDPAVGRMALDKQYHGDLEATSKGEMLTGAGSVKGSAGYVAMEKVTGALRGRTGTFTLQHFGTMQNGAFHLNVIVVPDSGTGQLKGLSGTMKILIAADGKHTYELQYMLPEVE